MNTVYTLFFIFHQIKLYMYYANTASTSRDIQIIPHFKGLNQISVFLTLLYRESSPKLRVLKETVVCLKQRPRTSSLSRALMSKNACNQMHIDVSKHHEMSPRSIRDIIAFPALDLFSSKSSQLSKVNSFFLFLFLDPSFCFCYCIQQTAISAVALLWFKTACRRG